MLSYLGFSKITSNLLGMNIKSFFLWKNILICLYSDILNQNISISTISIYHHPRTSWPTKKIHISELSGQIFTNLPRMCEKKNYVNKMKLKWQNYLKQKIYRTERKFIKLREEAKKPVSWHHDGDPFKDINYIFSLRAAFMKCH